jgi:hypothetical protein
MASEKKVAVASFGNTVAEDRALLNAVSVLTIARVEFLLLDDGGGSASMLVVVPNVKDITINRVGAKVAERFDAEPASRFFPRGA